MESAEQSTLAILAGGQGSRMGRPKAQLELDGQPILTYLLNRFAWKGPRYLITAPGAEHPPGATEFDLEIADPPAPCDKPLGPLRGILTALENLHTPLLMVTTVDMPALETVHLSYLLNQLVRLPDLAGLMFTREIEGKRIPEPFPLALRPGALPVIRDRLATPRRSVHGLLENPGFATTPASPSWNVWTNLNTPADFEQYRSATDEHQ